MKNIIKTIIGLIIVAIIITELAALLEHTSYINFSWAKVNTICSHFISSDFYY